MDDQVLLRSLLVRNDHPPVKILGGKSVRKISATRALMLAVRRDYQWGGSTTRIRWMREMPAKNAWERCWRTSEAAMMWSIGASA